jgi:glycine oxidase
MKRPVVILGAGLMGRLLACALARTGHAVTVYEAQGADAQGSAARVAAAMLAPLAESAVTELSVVRMGQHSLRRWPELLAQLCSDLSADLSADQSLGSSPKTAPQSSPAAPPPLEQGPVFFQRAGTLVVWHRLDAPEAQRFERQLAHTVQRLPDLPAAQRLGAAELAALEPALEGRFTQGLYLPEEGQLDNRALLVALGQTMQRLGVDVHWGEARTPESIDPGPQGWVFDCRGLGARGQWPALRGVRGEVMRVHAPGVQLKRPVRLLHPRYPLYIAPKPGDVFVIGATEIETDDLSPASVQSALELLGAAYTVHPGFAEGRIVEMGTQARPALPDNLPALRCAGPQRVQVNGLYRHGFLVAPAVLDALLALVSTGRPDEATRLGLRLEGF